MPGSGNLNMEKKAIAGFLACVIVLFYLSPFSEVAYPTKCFSYPFTTAGSAGAQIEAPCGLHIYGKTQYWPIFPFKPKSNLKIAFCRDVLTDVERNCGARFDDALLIDFGGYFHCAYIQLNPHGTINYLVRVTNYSNYLETKDAATFGITKTIVVSEQKTNDVVFVPIDACNDLETHLSD